MTRNLLVLGSRSSAMAIVFLIAGACSASQSAPPAQGEGSMATVSTLEGRRIDRETVAAIRRMEDFLPAIREIRSEPPVIELRVGEYLEFSEHLEIIAFDSTGTLLGPVPTYNQSLYPGAAELHNRGVIGVHAGESILKIEVPLWHQSGGRGPAPEVEIPVRVEPDEGTN